MAQPGPQVPPPLASPPRLSYASWGRRVGGYLIDVVLAFVACLPGWLLMQLGEVTTTTTTDPDVYGSFRMNENGSMTGIPLETTTTHWDTLTTVGFCLLLAGSFAFFVWNQCLRQGATGYTYGKQAVGIQLVKTVDGAPVGAGLSFGRQVAHILDSLPCYLGWFWPLGDAKGQTFADKVCDTVVIVPLDPPRPVGLLKAQR